MRRAALGTFPWPVYDQASIFFSKHISGLHTAFWLRDALLSIWSRMCRVLYVFDHACIWPRVLIGHACIWPHVYLAMRVSGHTCIWLCLYLGHVRFWWRVYSGSVLMGCRHLKFFFRYIGKQIGGRCGTFRQIHKMKKQKKSNIFNRINMFCRYFKHGKKQEQDTKCEWHYRNNMSRVTWYEWHDMNDTTGMTWPEWHYMSDMKWMTRQEWHGTSDMIWVTWHDEWHDMNDTTGMTWHEWHDMNDTTGMTWHEWHDTRGMKWMITWVTDRNDME